VIRRAGVGALAHRRIGASAHRRIGALARWRIGALATGLKVAAPWREPGGAARLCYIGRLEGAKAVGRGRQ
jgi:hypothetical protein